MSAAQRTMMHRVRRADLVESVGGLRSSSSVVAEEMRKQTLLLEMQAAAVRDIAATFRERERRRAAADEAQRLVAARAGSLSAPVLGAPAYAPPLQLSPRQPLQPPPPPPPQLPPHADSGLRGMRPEVLEALAAAMRRWEPSSSEQPEMRLGPDGRWVWVDPEGEAREPAVQPPEPKPAPKKDPFDLNKLAMLLDKQKPAPQAQETDKRARQQAAPAANSAPAASNLSEQLSMSEKDAIRQQIQGCWHFDAGARDARNLRVLVRFSLNPDGSVRGTPEIVDRARMGDPYFRAFAESAVRAVQKCSPLKDLPPRKYDAWRDVELNFDPREMLGG